MEGYLIGLEGVFPSPSAAVLFVFVQVGLLMTESRQRRRALNVLARAEPMFPPLWLALAVGFAARLGFGFLKVGVFRGELREALVWAGGGIALLGWWLRLWAQHALGRYFIGAVAVQPQQPVVQSGPYRWVRHPAYTGGFLASVGLGLMLSTWLGALVSALMLIWAYAVRVPREEQLLVSQLGEAYRAYMSRTRRFVPFVF
ncbi:MAG: isoprenylcysteine carboxylmethyltransferase family protein [Anaerolineae bacterium]|nr:isoprenylcysteine carboxylmethyltransferase family protein [Thermoflexales bacterium]MDW8396225.1 isoprenylcysteine carboxylmethyltransferase family protein [Anaerolineae bacterium]